MKHIKSFNILLLSIFFSAIAFSFVPVSLASIYTYSFTAAGTAGNPGTVVGTFGYDTAAIDQEEPSLTEGVYLTGFLNGIVSVGGHDFPFNYLSGGTTNPGDIFTRVQWTSEPNYSFSMNEYLSGSSSFYRLEVRPSLGGWPPLNDELPTTPDLSDFWSTGRLHIGTYPNYVEYEITSLSLLSTPVPEPTTIFLLGLGLMGLAGVRRFKN